VRRNSLHRLTSDLVHTYGTIVIEQLNVAGLMKNRRLARRLADGGLGTLRRQLAYKSAWAGSSLIEAGRFFPSSKICSGCGHVKAKLPLSEREYHCERCGMALDRDVNAARTLAMLVDEARTESPGVARRPKRPWMGTAPTVRWVVLDEAGSRRQVMRLG
jgi:putative transposase